MPQFQIHYQHGGHVGPYTDLLECIQDAKRKLLGLPEHTDKVITIWNDIYKHVLTISRESAARDLTEDELIIIKKIQSGIERQEYNCHTNLHMLN